ncbi:serine/threonine-protein phosphatase 7 long form homolog [Aegilops tauschii subsp. strangulata]
MLDWAFDKGHRARFIENGEMLQPLRMRGHGVHGHMDYDERYAPFFKRARLLGFVLQFKRQPPMLVHAALTALIDRWRPETHSFHLPCGEMTVTLEDWEMITSMPIEGHALTGRVERTNWQQRVTTLISDCPGAKSNRTFDVSLIWLSEHRKTCPEGADEATVEWYARAYLWYLLTEVVFPDSSGNSANWSYLFFLADWDAGYSWGTASLAYLYRSLDDATQRTGDKSNMGGFVWALSIWMWERLPVVRPEKMRRRPWEDYGEDGNETRNPTVAYEWDVVKLYTGLNKTSYKTYTNNLDTLTHTHVYELAQHLSL